jgi:hypothetical protein
LENEDERWESENRKCALLETGGLDLNIFQNEIQLNGKFFLQSRPGGRLFLNVILLKELHNLSDRKMSWQPIQM